MHFSKTTLDTTDFYYTVKNGNIFQVSSFVFHSSFGTIVLCDFEIFLNSPALLSFVEGGTLKYLLVFFPQNLVKAGEFKNVNGYLTQ